MPEKLSEIERAAVLGKIIRVVCHELRNPISAINTSAYYIKTNIPDDNPKLKKHINIIQEEIESATKILDNISLFYKSPEPDLVPTNINFLIEQVLTEIEKSTAQKEVQIVKDLDSSIPKIMVDMDQLVRAIENILQNALDAVKKGGAIKVSTKLEENKVLMIIEDNGCGIPKENIDKIFDPTFSTKSRGVGLGLAITQDIIQKHNGSINIESQIDKGTRIYVRLPEKTTKG